MPPDCLDPLFLPGLEQFESFAAHYSMALHELTHWTRGRPRLARPEIAEYHRGEEIRNWEELIAEIGGAANLCWLCSLDSPENMENSAAYIHSWLRIPKDNPEWVLHASKQACAAMEFILTGQIPSQEAPCHEAATHEACPQDFLSLGREQGPAGSDHPGHHLAQEGLARLWWPGPHLEA